MMITFMSVCDVSEVLSLGLAAGETAAIVDALEVCLSRSLERFRRRWPRAAPSKCARDLFGWLPPLISSI